MTVALYKHTTANMHCIAPVADMPDRNDYTYVEPATKVKGTKNEFTTADGRRFKRFADWSVSEIV